MAYQIDFTASSYILRSRRKVALRLLLVAAAAAVAWGVHDCYVTYNQPTLNMRLADYESVARPIEEMSVAWDTAAKEYNAMVCYYRLLWAANATNFLSAMAVESVPRLERGLRPVSWLLATGGECVLTYRYAFGPGDKAEQAKGLEDRVAGLVTSVVEVVGGRVDVQGVQHENLLNVDGFNVAAKFSLQNARTFPAKESTLAACVAEIGAMRKKVHEVKLENLCDDKVAKPKLNVDGIMVDYVPQVKDKSLFPDMKSAIDIAGWCREVDAIIKKKGMPADGKRVKLRETWDRIGEARLPWGFFFWNARYRALDSEELILATKVLGTVSDGVKRFKGFLEKRHADCLKKLEPFVEAYAHNDVFNNPFVETDLKERAARNAGISHATVVFKDESAAEPAVLEREDEKFTFSWVRWTLSIGNGADREGKREQLGGETDAKPVALANLDDCARRILSLGPGYAIEKLRIDFEADGTVAGAVFEGLLPVKKVESLKKETKDGH